MKIGKAMLSKNAKPNQEQKDWLKAIADFHNYYGLEYLYGDEWIQSPFQLHHVVGRSYKHNKIAIGHFFVLPVPIVLHDVHSNHELNVTHYRKRFTEHFGFQRYMYRKMVEKMRHNGFWTPCDEINNTIMLTRY